ncbi:MAG: HigA family addiction module antitoxin [Gammaproteobacteria bacterium]|nr:HigA family addiction module antitoxin [Gammaproteobacteria bacterium]MDE0301629.1 HigA family addiction module antitoxin [Gammaproteobacteria bacterium]
METPLHQFDPDYSVPPGWILEEYLETLGISHAEFAYQCGCSPKLISEIISGEAPLEAKTALQFEKTLGLDTSVWLGIEANYRLHQARTKERKSRDSASGKLAR